MKYPQLVSNRAINEISDWLITRLEELDIEQPGVYSRLLLSLLQTSFKVDSAELLDILQLKDIEKPHKLLKKSNEELQRLAAVQSLVEVSVEGNKSKIINLVNELHSKLRQVEDSSFEENFSSTAVTAKHSNFTKNLKKISSKKKDVIGEPDKNYYDVFPALSRTEKRANLPSLTTIVAASDHVDDSLKNSEKSSTVKLSKTQLCWSTLMSSVKEDASSLKLVESKAATKQRKKRRNVTRNGKLLNIIDVQYSSNNAKNYDVYHNATFLPKASKSNTKKHQRNCLVSSKYQKGSVVARNKNFSANDQLVKKKTTSTLLEKSVAPWDMDFQDHWVMDQDLISEFLLQQKKKKKEGEIEFVRHRFEADYDSKNVGGEDIEEDTMLKCLPDRLFHDDDDDDESDDEGEDDCDVKEDADEMNKDSLTILKMKFDANVKALWSDGAGDDSLKSSAFGFEYNNNNSDLSSSYVNDSSALSLFNFSNQLRSLGVITPSDPHFYIFNKSSNTSSSTNSTLVSDSNKKSSYQSLQQSNSSSLISPAAGTDKFIKLGTNLHSSIWSDCEQAQEDESVDYKIDSEDNFEAAESKQMPSIGAEIKSSITLDNDEDQDDAEISLFNHSDASAFKRFKPNLMPTIIRANYHPINNTKMDHALMSSSFDGENLLTSERTHFSPIICDGHNFAINNDWNKIKFERSPSGCLMHNNKRYMKWSLPITNVVEAAACASGGLIDLDAMENEESHSEFSIKFLVQTDNEKGCQTDMNDFIRLGSQGLMEINEKYLKRNIFTDYGYMGFSDNNMWQYHQEDSNDYTMTSSSSNQKPVSPADVYDDPYESWSNMKPEMLQNDHLRLLKDELRVDCDEIMSVIQNLYITGGDVCEDDEPEAHDDFEDMNHFYTDMLDESVETFDDCKFYDGGKRSKVDGDRFTPNLIEEQQFENFSDITRWSWSEDFTRDQEKYLNLLKWIQTTIFKESSRSDSNNNTHHEEQRKSSNRKRRHSTCQNYLGTSPKAPLIEENCNLFVDSAKLLKVNIERSLFMPNIEEKERHEHYRNILQQHILIKQMEHTRPLTR